MGKPQSKVKRLCPVCGVEYHADRVRLRHGRQTTCSRECSYKLRSMRMRNSVAVICATCGAEVNRTPSQIKAKHGAHYCSRACHYAGRSAGLTPRVVVNGYTITEAGRAAQKKARKRAVATRKKRGNYGHSKATRAKLRNATARNIASGKIKRVSGIEDIVADELAERGIVFKRQVGLRGARGRFVACVDFLLPAISAVIEVNGTFWHADPRFYDHADLSPAQTRTIERYARKVKHLAKSGLQLIEIWEHDIRECPKKAVADALSTIA